MRESLGGDSESGTYNWSERPAGVSRPDDETWAILPDDDPERPKQCGVCGAKWVDVETARHCERGHGYDIETITDRAAIRDSDEPSERGVRFATAAMAQARAAGVLVDGPGVGVSGGTVLGGDAEITRLRSVMVEEIARAEAAEAEVVTLRAKVAAVEALVAEWKSGRTPVNHRGYRAAVSAALATGEGK